MRPQCGIAISLVEATHIEHASMGKVCCAWVTAVDFNGLIGAGEINQHIREASEIIFCQFRALRLAEAASLRTKFRDRC
jgi:hypothetical protein